MTREEALDKFKSEEAGVILKKTNLKYYNQLVEKRDEFADLLRKGFWNIISRLESYPDFQVQEVQFSYLRVHIMDGTYQWLVELHDKNGDYTREDISQMLDMKSVLGVYDECRKELYQAAAKYVNTLTPADCDLIVMENFADQVMYLYILGVYAFRDIASDKRWEKIKKDKIFRILIGERKDKAFVVYAKIMNPEAAETVTDRISGTPTEHDFNSMEYVLYDFSNYLFNNRNICFRNMNFCSFRKCTMEETDFVGCKCMFTDWRCSHIHNVMMDGNCLNGADFTGSILENVSMTGVRLDVLPYSEEMPLNPAMIPATFRNATLKNVDFSGAYLAECDFRNACIGRINFAGADLRGAKIDSKYKELWNLTEEQNNSINWIEE